jgi:translation initiation factor 2B subunit (eIF-2B alpha/beta/delta family)
VRLLYSKIREIKYDRKNGASQIARNALGVLSFFVHTSKHDNCRDFKEDFIKVGRKLFEARPSMAPVQNLVAQIVYEVGKLKENDLVSVRKFAVSRINKLCKESEVSVKKCAELAVTIIGDADCLASCSDSSTVCETFRVAKKAGKSFKVYVAESRRDDGKFRYGEIMAEFLKSIDVHAKVFPDNEIHSYIPDVKCVLVGADSVLFDGSVINGRPTFELAVASKEWGIPFYSVCETSKVNILSYLGKKVELKKGFDLAPVNLITGIVTEKGILDINTIVEIVKNKSQFFEIFHIN